jgi:hypothetical protein
LLGIALLGLLTGPLTSQEAAEAPVFGQQQMREAPNDVVSDFLAAVRSTPLYDMAGTFNLEKSEALAAKWSKELGVQIALRRASLLEHVLAGEYQHDGKEYELATRQSGGGKVRLVLRVDKATYWVEPAELSELRLRFVRSFEAIDPANQIQDSRSFDSVPLSVAVEMLCRIGNLDWALRASEPETRVNLRVRNKSLAQTLKLAAWAAGWEVTFQIGGRSSDEIPNPSVGVWEYWEARTRGALLTPGGADGQDPVEGLHQRFAAEVKEMLADRPVAVFRRTEPVVKRQLVVPMEQ